MQKHDGDDLGAWSEFGTQAGLAASDLLTGKPSLGDNPDIDGLGDAPAPGVALGEAARDVPAPGFALGEAVRDAAARVGEPAPPEGYRNRVDADGDGVLDRATYRGRADGGADILVDVDGDGRTDFIGADVDLDNRVDFADYDKNRDGVFEKRMYDDDGDGYLDRTVWT